MHLRWEPRRRCGRTDLPSECACLTLAVLRGTQATGPRLCCPPHPSATPAFAHGSEDPESPSGNYWPADQGWAGRREAQRSSFPSPHSPGEAGAWTRTELPTPPGQLCCHLPAKPPPRRTRHPEGRTGGTPALRSWAGPAFVPKVCPGNLAYLCGWQKVALSPGRPEYAAPETRPPARSPEVLPPKHRLLEECERRFSNARS